MMTPESPERREFTRQAVMAILAGTTITISGCGGSGYGSPASPTPTTTTPSGPPDANGMISANHGHRAVVTGVEVVAASAVTLDIRGTATHSHMLVLTADEVATIKRGNEVKKLSTTGDSNQHTHTVTFHGTDGNGGGGDNPYDGY
jgi:hypothetical protein